MHIHSQDDLKNLLDSKGLDIAQWGFNNAKTVADLWEEIVKQETRIQEKPLLRIVEVVQVIVRKGDNVLIETQQEFTDGRTRGRKDPPAEKLRAGENHVDAALRCLKEELGIERKDIDVIGSVYRKRQEVMESPSYPGLKTLYIFHEVEARVNQLPDEDFFTYESFCKKNDPIRKHYWSWKNKPKELNRRP